VTYQGYEARFNPRSPTLDQALVSLADTHAPILF
jgi:hypothetical protein